ncbi:scarecrow-like protein 28 [Carica papaya]|uniref:scarecrow-like protein 28 n=1 Tax=Carica papaya TaxID=3649 RepID=UPI000B8CC386|nr:scarecrow-like protein 28 [Carica papaya]XP_021895335.1 scarecrow-like protein 28 [Carica papaya]
MLAGCSSSTLLSPRHRLRNEASAQYQACHFQLPSMSTQRLDLPCTFPRKETSRSQPIRPVGLSVEKPIESKITSSRSLKHNLRLPPLSTTATTAFGEGRREIKDEFWEGKGKNLKRFAEQGLVDDVCLSRAKRKKGGSDGLGLGQLGGNFWFQPNSQVLPFSLTYSGDEERACFVPGEVISPPLPLSNNPWLESVITEITDLGEKDNTSRCPVKEASGSSASSDSHSLGLKLNESNTEHEEVGNGSGNPYPYEGASVEAGKELNNRGEHQGFELLALLTGCVEAIGSKNIPAINHFIAKLGDLASPRAGNPVSRLTAYYTEALALRVTRLWPQIFHVTTPREFDRVDDDLGGTALRLLNQVSPIPKFIHFTANEMLLRAFEGKDRVHIIDFDIKQGLQWPSFFQSLACRRNPPTHVRITGIGESKQELNETGDRLAVFAESLNLPFEFHPVVDRLEDVRLWMLHVKEKENVGVNCIFQLHKILYDGNRAAFRDFLGLIRSTNPTAIVMAEQEAEHNTLSLESRVCNSLKYYAAIFDSINCTNLPVDSPVRMKIEEMFGREIRSIVACEGSERVERHERFEKWKTMMEQGGFRCMGVSEREKVQSQMLLKMYSCDNFHVRQQGEENDGAALTLTWEDQPLYTVSSWAAMDIGGSSSSFSQPGGSCFS